MTRLRIFARMDLVRHAPDDGAPCLLLEGSWPETAEDRPSADDSARSRRWSLDEAIDARFAWIDEEAQRLADLAGDSAERLPHAGGECGPGVSPVWLNALPLRYYLLKLLRLVAWCTEIQPLWARDGAELFAARGRDEDYAAVLQQWCDRCGAEVRVQWIDGPGPPAESFPANARWRRWLSALGRLADPRVGSDSGPRVVLCGNPRVLDPVSAELVARACCVWWLYDRFALRSWLRWRAAGVGQLVCDSSLGKDGRLQVPRIPRLECRGVDLSAQVARWIEARLAIHGRQQTRLVEQVDRHFSRLRPDWLVVDQDATPMTRAAIAMARRYGARSFVVQHGAPLARFGFAPCAADRILVWGTPSQWQLERWGVPAERIEVTGSPWHDLLYRKLCQRGSDLQSDPPCRRGPRILLLNTVPPRDDRPDVVAFHFTRATYRQMLETAVAAVAVIPGAELILRPHPRAAHDPVAQSVLGRFSQLKATMARGGALEKWLAQADCVVSCMSSSGVDATLAGLPVIQLAPEGSGNVLPSRQWGMLGTARSREELDLLLQRALGASAEAGLPHTDPKRKRGSVRADAFANLDGQAAARVADSILAKTSIARGSFLRDCHDRQHAGTMLGRVPACQPVSAEE